MRPFPIILYALLFCALLPGIGSAGVEIYTGTMDVVRFSGKSCAGLTGRHAVSLVIHQDEGGIVSGYFWGQRITTGRFSGSNRSALAVSYPYQDTFKATGHQLSITSNANDLVAELRDRHIEPDVDDCNFDLAKISMSRTSEGKEAEARLKLLAGLFDAQLVRSEAFSLARAGHYDSALPLYEKALALAEPAAVGNETLLAPYITGLANAYVKLGRFDAFNKLYDERIDAVNDEGVRAIFTGHRVHSLFKSGKAALAREEYPAAMESFRKAYELQPQNRDVIAAVMTAHLRTRDLDSAIVFLAGAVKKNDDDNVREEVRAALAYVYFLRSKESLKDNRNADAEADLKNADTRDPKSVKYLIALARLRHKAGSLAEAERLLQQGLERSLPATARQEIIDARDKMRQTEAILNKLRRVGG